MRKDELVCSLPVAISIPYGHGYLDALIPAKNLTGIYDTRTPSAAADQKREVERALDNPAGSKTLDELAKGKKSAVVITSDHTRPVPSKIIMPSILERLRSASPDIDITILVATGFHRGTTKDELENKLGKEIVANEKIVVHDASDESNLVSLGKLPSGGELVVNKLALETELLVAEGFIEPHFFAGFSGGRKSVLPGIASGRTVLANHCSEFIQSPFARAGVLENNPVHRDMVYAAEAARLAFIVNVVIDSEKRIVRAFAGDPFAAHGLGCEYLRGFCGVEVPESDIVITGNGGYPLDQNVYQSVKGMTSGEAVCRDGGVIIMVASCSDGHGGESFYRNLAESESPLSLLEKVMRVPMDETLPDQWEFQILARILSKHIVILVTNDCPHDMLHNMHLKTASTIAEAIDAALKLCGENAKISVIPDGVSVIAKVKNK